MTPARVSVPGLREQRVITALALIPMGINLSFAVGYLIAGTAFRWPMIACIVAASLDVLAFAIMRRGRTTLAASVGLFSGIGILVVNGSLMGLRVGFQYYLFTAVAIAFMVFERRRRFQLLFAAAATVAFLMMRVCVPEDGFLDVPLPRLVAGAIDASSIAVVCGMLGYFAFLFVDHTLQAEEIAETEQARLKQSEQARSRLFTNLSHDFRTPLAIIAGEADGLSKATDAQEVARASRQIARNAWALADLTDQLLELARLEAGRTPVETRTFDLVEIGRQVSAQMAPPPGSGRIVVDSLEPVPARADPAHARRILCNVVANGLRQVRAHDGTVSIRVVKREGAAVVEISDDGAGISPDRRAAIFDRFSSFDAAGSVASGIGLPLARELAEIDGGSLVLVEDRPHTTFRLELPLGTGATETIVPPRLISEAPDTRVHRDHARAHVLVVEDNAEMASLLAKQLSETFDVDSVASVAAAKEGIVAAEPHAVVSDIMLGEEDGYALLSWLRGRDAGPVPFVFVSALADAEQRARGLRAGADDYLGKPFSPEELRARVGAVIERAHQRKAALRTQRDEFLAELHDGVAASLSRASLALGRLEAPLDAVRPLSDALADGLAEAQAMMSALQATAEPWDAVVASIRRSLAESCEHAGLEFDFETTTDKTTPLQLTAAQSHTARRIAREAMTNVLKHARAKRVRVAIAVAGETWELRVEDDGCGLPNELCVGHGHAILARRARRIGGSIEIRPVSTGGTAVIARFPLSG